MNTWLGLDVELLQAWALVVLGVAVVLVWQRVKRLDARLEELMRRFEEVRRGIVQLWETDNHRARWIEEHGQETDAGGGAYPPC